MMRRKGNLGGRSRQDSEFLAAALIGYQQQRAEIDGKIAELRQQLGGRRASVPAGSSDGMRPLRKRTMSAAARKRIADAQRKRWAKMRERLGRPVTAKAAGPKRRISAAGRKRIIEATRKRWAAYRAQKSRVKKASAKA